VYDLRVIKRIKAVRSEFSATAALLVWTLASYLDACYCVDHRETNYKRAFYCGITWLSEQLIIF